MVTLIQLSGSDIGRLVSLEGDRKALRIELPDGDVIQIQAGEPLLAVNFATKELPRVSLVERANDLTLKL